MLRRWSASGIRSSCLLLTHAGGRRWRSTAGRDCPQSFSVADVDKCTMSCSVRVLTEIVWTITSYATGMSHSKLTALKSGAKDRKPRAAFTQNFQPGRLDASSRDGFVPMAAKTSYRIGKAASPKSILRCNSLLPFPLSATESNYKGWQVTRAQKEQCQDFCSQCLWQPFAFSRRESVKTFLP